MFSGCGRLNEKRINRYIDKSVQIIGFVSLGHEVVHRAY
jgi:hypothetical protein